jgi:hypothetical protein
MHHLSSHVAAGDVWQWNPYAVEAAALPEIEMVERAGAHAHQRGAVWRSRFWSLLESKYFGSAVGVKPDCLHARSLLQGLRAKG